jgi:hypothetical protein
MSNMSYCRFENTLHDLRDCQDHFGDKTNLECECGHTKERHLPAGDGIICTAINCGCESFEQDVQDDPLSRSESQARDSMLELMVEILEENGYTVEKEVANG